MKRAFSLALCALSGSCAEGGAMLEITSVVKPGGRGVCSFFGEDAASLTSGIYDPTFPEALAYQLGLRLVNHMVDKRYDEARGPSEDNVRPEANTATVNGAHVCLYREEDPNLDLASPGAKGSVLVNCASLPEDQQLFIAANATVRPDGAKGVAVVAVLSDGHLNILYGSDFDPKAIPPIGGMYDPERPGMIVHDPRSNDPSNLETRSAAWGNYPTTRRDRVVVQVRAEGKLQSGWGIETNVFHFPIEITVGQMAARCGVQTLQQCNNCQGVSIPCLTPNFPQVQDQRECWLGADSGRDCTGVCPGDTHRICYPFAFAGEEPDRVEQDCLYYQGVNDFNCEQHTGCDDVF